MSAGVLVFIADVEGEGLLIADSAGLRVEAGGLQVLSAVAEPQRFGYEVDKIDFVLGGGLVFVQVVGEKLGEGDGRRSLRRFRYAR